MSSGATPTRLLVAAHRGIYHITELAGGDFIVTIYRRYQQLFLSQGQPKEDRINQEIPEDSVDRLLQSDELGKAYHIRGMRPDQFISYGATQRTLTQFSEAG
jgi:transaldolase